MSNIKSIADIPIERMGAPNIDISRIRLRAPEIITDDLKKEMAKVKRNLKGIQGVPTSIIKTLAKSKFRKMNRKVTPSKTKLNFKIK